MTASPRKLAKAIRHAAQRELRTDPAQWREFTRRRQRVKPLVWKGFAILGMLVLSALPLVSLTRSSPEARAGWAALFLFLSLCVWVTAFLASVQQKATVLERLPITDRDIFRTVWREFLVFSAYFLPSFWLFFHRFTPGGDAGGFLLHGTAAVLLAATMLATMCVATAWLRAGEWAPKCQNFGLVAFVICLNIAGDRGNELLRYLVDQLSLLLRLTTPPGWMVSWFMDRPAGEMRAALWLLPVAAVLAAAFPAWRRLRDTYVVQESAPRLPQLTPVQAMQFLMVTRRNELATPCLLGLSAIEESLRGRAFLGARPGLHCGWIDRLVWRWLTARERVLLDFLVLVLPRWAGMWRLGLAAGAVGLLSCVLLRASQPEAYWLAGALGGLGLLVMALPMSNGFSRAFAPCPVAGGAPLTFAGCLPIGYAEVFRLDGKVSLVRAMAGLPLALAFGGTLAALVNVAPALGALMALKAVAGVLALRSLMVTFMFSSGTNDTQLTKLRGWAMLLSVLFVGITTLVLGIVTVMMTAWWNLITLPAMALLCWAFHRYHRRRYDRMGFDLQPSKLLGQYPVG